MHVVTESLTEPVKEALKTIGYDDLNIQLKGTKRYSLYVNVKSKRARGIACVVNLKNGSFKINYGAWGGKNPYVPGNKIDTNNNVSREMKTDLIILKGYELEDGNVYLTAFIEEELFDRLSSVNVTLTEDEKKGLQIINNTHKDKRAEAFGKAGLGIYIAENPIIKSLEDKGLLKSNKIGSIYVTKEGKDVL